MAKVIIFGVLDFASLAHYYLRTDSKHEVVAFTVSKEYMPDNAVFEGLPVVPFEDIEKHYSTDEYCLFAPLSHRSINRLRESIYDQGKNKGYTFVNYISSHATVLTDKIGDNNFILEDNTIQPFVEIGNNCVFWSGNHIGHHSKIDHNVFFTSHVVLSGHCDVGANSFFGVNATIRDGAKIGEGSLIAMGALITKDTNPWHIYKGAPAKHATNKNDEPLLSKDIDF